MRILHIDDYYLPWLGYEAELARAQHQAGHQVWFAASSRVPGEKAGRARPADSTAGPVHAVLLRPVAIRQRIVLLPGILGVLWRFRPQVVHCHGVFDLTAVTVAVCKPLFRYRVVFCCHTSRLNAYNLRRWWGRLAYGVFRRTGGILVRAAADHLVAVGENEKEMLVGELGVRPERVDIVRLGVSPEVFAIDTAARQRERARLGFGESDVVLLHTGTLALRKAIPDLVEAAAALGRLKGTVRLVIVGGGDPGYIASLEELARRRSLGQQTRIIGHFVSKEELVPYYAAADIGVWPGEISIATVEAMAAGLPLVVKAGDPYREYLVSNRNGLTYAPGDVDSLAACIAALVEDGGKRLAMGKASRELAMAEFNWVSIARKFLQMYEQGRSRSAVVANVSSP